MTQDDSSRHRGEGGAGGALAPPLFWLIKLLFQFFSKVLHEAIDLMVNAIDLRFNQASYRVYEKMESFLVKCLNCQNYSTELRYLETNYKDDVYVGTLNAQLEIFKLLMKEGLHSS